MKKYFFLFIGLSVILTACDSGAAEKAADEFHKRLDNGEVDYICQELLDTKSTPKERATFKAYLESVRSMGEMKNRKKEIGFSQKINNGITTVKLEYTFEVEDQLIYENVVFVDRGEGDGYKLLVVSMNPDKDVVDNYTQDY
jgi:regulator of sigma D